MVINGRPAREGQRSPQPYNNSLKCVLPGKLSITPSPLKLSGSSACVSATEGVMWVVRAEVGVVGWCDLLVQPVGLTGWCDQFHTYIHLGRSRRSRFGRGTARGLERVEHE